MADLYRSGDHYVLCDVCGFKKRASETRMRWDNLRVCKADWEARHPQDFIKPRRDRQAVPNPRPEPQDSFLGPLDVLPDNDFVITPYDDGTDPPDEGGGGTPL